MASDGHTYSKAAILAWFAASAERGVPPISPCTHTPFPSTALVPNRVLHSVPGQAFSAAGGMASGLEPGFASMGMIAAAAAAAATAAVTAMLAVDGFSGPRAARFESRVAAPVAPAAAPVAPIAPVPTGTAAVAAPPQPAIPPPTPASLVTTLAPPAPPTTVRRTTPHLFAGALRKSFPTTSTTNAAPFSGVCSVVFWQAYGGALGEWCEYVLDDGVLFTRGRGNRSFVESEKFLPLTGPDSGVPERVLFYSVVGLAGHQSSGVQLVCSEAVYNLEARGACRRTPAPAGDMFTTFITPVTTPSLMESRFRGVNNEFGGCALTAGGLPYCWGTPKTSGLVKGVDVVAPSYDTSNDVWAPSEVPVLAMTAYGISRPGGAGGDPIVGVRSTETVEQWAYVFLTKSGGKIVGKRKSLEPGYCGYWEFEAGVAGE